MSHSSTSWLRPATAKEEYFEVAHELGCCRTFYSLGLSSTRPLEEDMVRSALLHLYRKVPVLRLRLGRREGRLWLRQMSTCVLDFKVVEDGVVEDEEEKLMDYRLNAADGPMWCVRLLRGGHSHQCVLMLGIHHTLADGFTNIKICNLLHTILDDMATGRLIDDEEQLGHHVGDEQSQQLYERERQRFLQDPDLWSKRKEELLTATNPRPPLLAALPPPREEHLETRSVKLVIDELTTEAFRKKCKSEGANIHSGLTGVINAASVRMLEDLPEAPSGYDFVCSHDLGLRRYYEGDTSRILGCHIPTFSFKLCLKTPKDVVLRFWPYVKEFHHDFHKALRERAPLQAVALRLLEKSKEDTFKEYFRETPDPDYSYALSNMGDVTSMLPGDGDHVTVTNLTRFSTLRSAATIMCFYVHTFRGRLNINMAYSMRFMGRDTARQILDHMKETIEALL